MEIKNKVVVVTGASEGIGKCLVIQLAQKGARVIMLARSIDKLKLLEQELSAKNYSVEGIKVDLTSNKEIKTAFEQIKNKYPCLDLLINNAAVGLFAKVKESTLEDAQKVFATNFFAPLECIKQALPLMSKSGSIVNISSAIARHASFYQGVYSASKSALDRLSEALRIEEGKNGLNVCTIYIDRTNTHFKDHLLGSKENYVLPFKKISITEPEAVADKIITAIERNKSRHHTSLKSRLFAWGSSLSPSVIHWLFARQYEKLEGNK